MSTFTPPTIPKDLRISFAKARKDDDEDANRLAQARQDLPYTLRDAHAPKPYGPEDLYEMLPKPFRALCGRATYGLNTQNIEVQETGTNRTALNVVVTSDEQYLPQSSTQRVAKRSGRMVFSSPPQQDVTTARFMASVITNICERIPVELSEIDQTLMDFVTTTAAIHSGITSHRLPTVKVCPPSSHGLPARVESTISVTYRGVDQATPDCLQIVSCSLSIPLSQVPEGPALEIPSAFLLPAHTRLPSEADVGFSKDVMRRAVRIMHWMQSHVHRKVFAAEKEFNRFINHLILISCPATAPRQRVSGEDEDDDFCIDEFPHGDELFAIRRPTRSDRYRITPRAPVQEDLGGALSAIILPDCRGALLRVLERLDTVFLATGRLEDGWEAACYRADTELLCARLGEIHEDATCICMLEERSHTVHRCDECFARLLCGNQYQFAEEDDTIYTPRCAECR